MAKSYAVEVIADAGGNWAGNALRFATAAEAEAWGNDLAYRWLAVRGKRIVETNDPVNYTWDGTNLTEVKSE